MSQESVKESDDLKPKEETKENSEKSAEKPAEPIKYRLQSEDGQVFLVNRRPMRASSMIFQYFIDHGYNDRNCQRLAPVPIPFPGFILDLIIKWMEKHQDDPPRREKISFAKFSSWDKQFFRIESSNLFAMLNASHCLGIDALMNMGCCAAAELIRGKNTAEIRKIYGIKTDEEQIEEMIANGEPGPSGLGDEDSDDDWEEENKKKKKKGKKKEEEKEKEPEPEKENVEAKVANKPNNNKKKANKKKKKKK